MDPVALRLASWKEKIISYEPALDRDDKQEIFGPEEVQIFWLEFPGTVVERCAVPLGALRLETVLCRGTYCHHFRYRSRRLGL
jgi:hypothetical protein